MATLVINCDGTSSSFENNGNIRITYSTPGDGSITVTEIEGMRTDGYSSYEDASQTIKLTIGGVAKTINVTRVRFMANSAYATWGLTDTTWTGLSGSVNVVLSGLTHWSGAAYYNKTFSASSAIDVGALTYLVRYHPNGGTGGPGTQSISSDTFTLSSTKPTYGSRTFLGWCRNPNSVEPRYQPGDNLAVVDGGARLNFYAIWSQDPVIKIKQSSTWEELTGQAYIKINGVWKSVDTIKLKTNGDF